MQFWPIMLVSADFHCKGYFCDLYEIAPALFDTAETDLVSAAIKHTIAPIAPVIVEHSSDGIDISLQMGFYLIKTIL